MGAGLRRAAVAAARTGGAVISDDGRYRYSLTRSWSDERAAAPARPVVWIMLNPSTADATDDDPTIRRCVGFTRSFGYHTLTVVNLFAYRATDPQALVTAGTTGVDIVGRPANDDAIGAALDSAGLVVAAWGAHPLAETRAVDVHAFAAERGVTLHHLGLTKVTGCPRHPLYLLGTSIPRPLRRYW